MNAEEVVEKILSDARAEADAITGEAKAKAESQAADQQAELERFEQQTQELAEKAAQEKRERILASARMDIRKATLAKKREIIDEVFNKSVKKLSELEEKEYLKLIESLMTKAAETGSEKVIIGKDENRIDANFVKQINRKLGPGYKGNLQLSDERAEISGGFILRRGNVQINVSTDVLVDQVREELEMELAGELFE